MTEDNTSTLPVRRSRLIWVVIAVTGLLFLACADDSGGDTSSDASAQPSALASADGAEGDSEGVESTDGGESSDGGAPCKDTPPEVSLDTADQSLYAGRADTQSSDHEAVLGDCVRLAGYTAYVDSAAMVTPEFGDPQLVLTVRVQNRDDRAQSYNTFDWKLQTENGQVLDPTFSMATTNDLGSGDLVTGGEVTGEVAFDVPAGTYFVIYKPDPFNDVRGIWQVTV